MTKQCERCRGEGWIWDDIELVSIPCRDCRGEGSVPYDEDEWYDDIEEEMWDYACYLTDLQESLTEEEWDALFEYENDENTNALPKPPSP